MKRKLSVITSVVMALMLAMSCFVTAFAAEAQLVISTAEELDAFAAAVNAGDSFEGKTVVLGSDITVSDSFLPIGTKAAPFSGKFDGNNKTVSDIYVECDYAGLFGYTDGAEIANVTVLGEISADKYAGAVVAYAENTVIENCSCEAYIYAYSFAGGIAGYIKSGKITDCTSAFAAVYGYTEATGGIAGFSGADIENCVNNAAISGAKNVGGIVGESAGNVSACTNLVAVYATSMNLGGIAGISDGNITYCVNKGKIAPTSGKSVSNVGGIAGMVRKGSVKECASYGTVNATSNFAGGIAGYATDCTISDCIATGSILNISSYAGGIFGCAINSEVTKCVSTSSVAAKASTDAGIGGVCQGTVSDCYYYNGEDRAVVVGTATADMVSNFTDKSVLPALDFVNTWAINTSHASYPLLKSIPYHTLVNVSEKEATCTEDGFYKADCTVCKEKIDIVYPANGHTLTIVSSKAPTCVLDGYEDGICTVCSATSTVTLAATGHTDADSNRECDTCKVKLTADGSEEKSFFEKIADFFNMILEWIKGLFS